MKFDRYQKSLFGRLLSGFVVVLTMVWACALAHIVYQANTDMVRLIGMENRAYTKKFLIGAQALKGNVTEIAAFVDANEKLRIELFGEMGMGASIQLFVWKGATLVYGTPGVQAPPRPLSPSSAAVRDGWVGHVEYDAAQGLTVMRTQLCEIDWMFTPQGAGYLLTPLVFSLPFMLLPAWFIVRRGLRPLHQIVRAIEERSPSELVPLPASSYRELSPLVNAVNHLMTRLSERLAREQEFLTDAAHELKTPLSVIQANAHLLHISELPQERREAKEGLALGVARATHTVHQLLALERVQGESGRAELQEYDFKQLLCDRLAMSAPLAITRGIEIDLRAPRNCRLPLHRESMAAMLDNLIGNAIKYSPDGGQISVVLEVMPPTAILRISDQGPGIPEDMHRKVFERFYRLPGQAQDGSGLGLAIAERAAQHNKATISFSSAAHGPGLIVTVTLQGLEAASSVAPDSVAHDLGQAVSAQ